MRLDFACALYDRTAALLDGRVKVPGVTLDYRVQMPGVTFPRAFQSGEYDVSELSFASFLLASSRNNCDWVGLPVFVSRAFRHNAIWVRTDRGIKAPQDLDGRTVGVPEYQQTAALWTRGMLADDWGVDLSTIRWRTGGTNKPGRRDRLALDLPGGIEVAPLAEGATLKSALLAGDVDAIFTPELPLDMPPGAPVARLWPDWKRVETDYARKWGFIPPMHIIGIRRRHVQADPTLPRRLYDAFCAAKALAEEGFGHEEGILPVMLPWMYHHVEETRAALGADWWPYGLKGGGHAVATLIRYAREQGIAAHDMTPEELFGSVGES
ncbi:MAG: hypothetical protein IT557_17025 [Alphaproteobacteria bacterium]|nr:hypothetical protein [Alphaproteobacteria bacterium]